MNPITTEQRRSLDVARVVQEARDRKADALVRMLRGLEGGYPTPLIAWEDVTGRSRWDPGVDAAMEWMTGAAGAAPAGAHLRESVDSSSWTSVLGDAVERAIQAEFADTALTKQWNAIASSRRYSCDFRTITFARIGGYGTLPTVAQGGTFQGFTTPAAEGATTAVAKKGGTERITFEAIAADDTGALQRIVRALGRSAAFTQGRAIFDLFTTNPTCSYDSVQLFHASHANTAANALSTTALATARLAMRQQAALSDTADVLAIVPRYLLVGPALEGQAESVCSALTRPSAWESDPAVAPAIRPLVVPHWTSTTAWYLAADPTTVETIGVAYTNTTGLPEVTIARSPNAGSMFNVDVLDVRIRHTWGLVVADHRGLARGNS